MVADSHLAEFGFDSPNLHFKTPAIHFVTFKKWQRALEKTLISNQMAPCCKGAEGVHSSSNFACETLGQGHFEPRVQTEMGCTITGYGYFSVRVS